MPLGRETLALGNLPAPVGVRTAAFNSLEFEAIAWDIGCPHHATSQTSIKTEYPRGYRFLGK